MTYLWFRSPMKRFAFVHLLVHYIFFIKIVIMLFATVQTHQFFVIGRYWIHTMITLRCLWFGMCCLVVISSHYALVCKSSGGRTIFAVDEAFELFDPIIIFRVLSPWLIDNDRVPCIVGFDWKFWCAIDAHEVGHDISFRFIVVFKVVEVSVEAICLVFWWP
jgi:hypothetical protein